MLLKILKIITFPLWFPLKVLWFISKVVAILVILATIILLIYGYIYLN
jgi:hypothetical protein